ncbi:hypothetical protein SBA2_40044 [Acidobacteriia bacterium SbA2]|nr:hypothetical protein SBA2_40044 [Acidobacteriia bacterium SbA2]
MREQVALATAGGTPALRSRTKPIQKAALEFLGGSAEGATVVGVGDFPEFGFGGTLVNALRVAHGNVAVDFAVNQQDRDFCRCNGVFGGNIVHAEVVLHTRAEEGDFY